MFLSRDITVMRCIALGMARSRTRAQTPHVKGYLIRFLLRVRREIVRWDTGE